MRPPAGESAIAPAAVLVGRPAGAADPVGGREAAWGGGPYARAVRDGQGPLLLRWEDDGTVERLPVERWCGPADAVDRLLLARCRTGPVLDLGCGPGRLVGELRRWGVAALGVDPVCAAAAATRARGAAVLERSVFDRLPGEGRWPAVLLADGNAGIGGDPVRVLARAAELAAWSGAVLVEAATGGARGFGYAHLEDGGGGVGARFPWARPGAGEIAACGAMVGLGEARVWGAGGRVFVEMRRVWE